MTIAAWVLIIWAGNYPPTAFYFESQEACEAAHHVIVEREWPIDEKFIFCAHTR